MRGTYTTTVIAKAGGQPVEEDRGNWLWIVKRQRDCSWKIFRAIGVSEPLVTEVRAPAVPETSKHGR